MGNEARTDAVAARQELKPYPLHAGGVAAMAQRLTRVRLLAPGIVLGRRDGVVFLSGEGRDAPDEAVKTDSLVAREFGVEASLGAETVLVPWSMVRQCWAAR